MLSRMRFELIDSVLEMGEDRIVTLKQVTAGEEYLQDHFPTFPILPGVMMIEAVAQAARRLIDERRASAGLAPARYVLGSAKGVKYGAMVRPGEGLRVEVSLRDAAEALAPEPGPVECKASATVVRQGAEGEPTRTAVSGKVVMRPVRLGEGGARPRPSGN